MRLVFDMSSVMWTALHAGIDKEFGRKVEFEGRMVQVNGAAHGYENAVNHMVSVLKRYSAAPRDMILVFEGQNSKLLRTGMYPEYKATRGGKPPEAYEEFNKLKDTLRQTWRDLGAIAVHQDGIEGDDVLAYFAKALTEDHVIATNDGDLCALVGGKTKVYCKGEENPNPYGPFSHRYITLYKALVGDTSDNIKGAKGFGDKAWLDLLTVFGEEGLELLEMLVTSRKLEELAEDVKELKSLQRLIDGAKMVYTSWDVARLYPDKVNTMRKPLQWAAGMVIQMPSPADQRLAQWYGHSKLIGAHNYQQTMNWLGRALPLSPYVALDIETSTPVESDDWLEAKMRGKAEEGKDRGVDVFGSKLTGLSLTFGDNGQYTVYFTVDHKEGPAMKNVTSAQVCAAVQLVPQSTKLVIQNLSFELPVLFMEWGEILKDNGWHGFLPNGVDTKVMSSYVDENLSNGLKQNSERYLGYKQVSYAEVTGGRKMNELTAEEAFAYGCDDTICTAALYNFYSLIMDLERTRKVYDQIEIEPAYLDAQRFVQGATLSMEKLLQLEVEDEKTHDAALDVLHAYLVAKGWEGAVCPQFDAPLEPADVKLAYNIITGEELKTMVRKLDKIAAFVGAQDAPAALQIAHCIEQNDIEGLNALVKLHFVPERSINFDSPQQMKKLLYETMGLPVRLFNKPTDKMRSEGLKQGTPQTDNLAIEYALVYDKDTHAHLVPVLKAVQTIKTTATRKKMYYEPYKRGALHWKDGKVHANINQCATVTRRYSGSDPNLQQLPKHPKHGEPAKFRQVFVPHRKDAVVVSLDFSGQELRLLADQSQDPNLLACYVGDNKKDVHCLTGHGILVRKDAVSLWRKIGLEEPEGLVDLEEFKEAAARWKSFSYEEFERANADRNHRDNKLVKQIRFSAKAVNFGTTFGAQAAKLAKLMIIPEDEAQMYIEAKLEKFPREAEWKKELIGETRQLGYVKTMMGGIRHLAEVFRSDNKWDIARAERQAVNFRIQGSAAEMTKLAMKRVWQRRLTYKYDAVFIGPIHDELVFSVAADDVVLFIKELDECMTGQYADMKVPVIASISFGKSFGEQIECGEIWDENKLSTVLNELIFKEKEVETA